MSVGIKEYITALSQEVLPAFRRGVITVTVLAYIVIAGSFVFLGWHLNFTTFQLWTGALLIAVLEVLIILPYRLWAKLTDQVTSGLECSFAMNDPGCVRPDTNIFTDGTPIACTWYRLRVEALGARAIGNCSGRLISVKRGGEELLLNETPTLPFAPHEQADALCKTIFPKVPVYLDLLGAQEKRGIAPAFRGPLSPAVNWKKLFREPGEYDMRVAIVSPESPTATIDIRFNWTLDPKTTTMLALG